MVDKIKTICLILITLSVIIGVGFYAWSVHETQEYYREQALKIIWEK